MCSVRVQETHRTQRSSSGVLYNGTGMNGVRCWETSIEAALRDDVLLGQVYLLIPGKPA